MSERSDKHVLLDMLEAIERATRYTKGMTLEAFVKDEMVCDAVVRNIQIIGEAANRTSKPLRDATSHLEWPKIIGMRHRLVHDYFEIEESIVWRVVTIYLPPLAEELKKVLESEVE
jgi:uncharacterized protein with HEPN domain